MIVLFSLSRFALGILKSEPLRMYANVISYTDKKFASQDAMRIGRLHCFNRDWERASLNFLKSGGFVFSDKISSVYQKTLVIWGKDDKILDVSNAEKLQKTLPNADLVYVDACGHVPHLEKAVETSSIIKRFIDN
jgi:pimeloyl-ACP methyl ester carboxylesterase